MSMTLAASPARAHPDLAETPAGGPATEGTPKERDSVVDNARFILIVLVVLGHFLTTMQGSPALDVLYSWIYMFHMPAFVFLSGLVINAEAVTARQGSRLVSGLLAPLVIFTVLYEVFGLIIGQPVPSDDNLMDPYWLLWFIVALTIWRLMVPVLRSLRWPVATTLVISTVLVLVSNLPAVWSIDRVIVLLPFFTAGLMVTPERIRALRTRRWRLVSAGILLVSVPLSVWVTQLPAGFITFNDGVESIGDVPEFLFMYLVATAMIVALLSLTPSSRSAMTKWGTRTMYVYLLHGFFVRAFRDAGLGEALTSPAGLLLVLVVSIGLAIVLSSDGVVRMTRRLVEPDVSWLLRDPARDAAKAAPLDGLPAASTPRGGRAVASQPPAPRDGRSPMVETAA